MTTTPDPDRARLIDDHLSNTFVATIDTALEAASDAAFAIDPTSSLATRLRALGLDDRVLLVKPSRPAPRTAAHRAPELGFDLLWRFGPPRVTTRIAWRARLDEDGIGRTLLTITVRAQASNEEASKRSTAAWPIIETIAREHARQWRRAVAEWADDRWEAERPPRRAAGPAAA